MTFLKYIFRYIFCNKSKRPLIICIHLGIVLALWFSDVITDLFNDEVKVYSVSLVNFAPPSANEAAGTTKQPEKPKPPVKKPEKPKPPVKKAETPKKPKPPVKKAEKPKPSVKKTPTKKPSSNRRTAADILREMDRSETVVQPRPEIKLDEFKTNDIKKRLKNAIGKIKVSKSSSSTSSSSSSNFNYNSYYSKVTPILKGRWRQPNLNQRLSVTVQITVSKSGRILSKKIVRSSGNSTMDASIRSLLSGLTYLPPLPATTTDSKLKFEIEYAIGD